jgi:hypothetical protein
MLFSRVAVLPAAALSIALVACPALANQSLIEAHVAATYHYVLVKGEASARGSLAAGASGSANASKSEPALRGGRLARAANQGTNRLAQCPGCTGEPAIAPPRGMH